MTWEVEYTNEFEAWWETLSDEDQEAIDAAIEALEEHGPTLGRPLAENIHQSRHPNMKELRVPGRSGSSSHSTQGGSRSS